MNLGKGGSALFVVLLLLVSIVFLKGWMARLQEDLQVESSLGSTRKVIVIKNANAIVAITIIVTKVVVQFQTLDKGFQGHVMIVVVAVLPHWAWTGRGLSDPDFVECHLAIY